MPALTRSIPPSVPAFLLCLLAAQPVWALRFGALGNSPVDDPGGWPAGAAAVFNVPQRIAYWEHNGKWTSDCRGDAEAFNKVLADFALVDAEAKRLVVHDGVGSSYWVEAVQPDADAQVDWMFIVWQPDVWRMWQRIGRGARAEGAAPPAPRIDVYVGGNIDWDEVVIPEGIEVVDQRLEAHGFSLADGNVIEGTVHDLATGEPLAATMELVQFERLAEGGYRHTTVRNVKADDQGHWVLTSAPQGLHSIVLSADGYAPRHVGSVEFDEQPSWSSFDAGLARAVSISGTVTDEAGNSLEGAVVHLRDVVASGGVSYGLRSSRLVTDENGRFETDQAPEGSLSLRATKDGFVFPGLGETVATPVEGVELTMVRAARVEVVVDFGDKPKPESYLVHIEPEEGLTVGSWGGTADVDASGFHAFENVPPGRYVLWGRPNPGSDSEQTETVTVELIGGETTEVMLRAR